MKLEGVSAVLLDIDGVLYVEDEPVPGAVEAVDAIRGAGLGLRLVTNTTALSRAGTLEKLGRLGFEAAVEELVTPAALARRHCESAGHRKVALVMNKAVKEDFEGLEEVEDGADAVIMGDLGDSFSYEILNRAFQNVIEGAELIALQKNRYWMKAGGLSLDAGPFVAAIEYATGTDARVVGKPAPSFFELVLDGLGVSANAAVMVGDDVESDVGGAMKAGLRGVLVKTGKYREKLVRESGVEPTATLDTVAELPGALA